MTSKVSGYVYVCIIYFVIVISARSIYDIENENNYEQRTEILLANYRHRFDHSMNLRKLRWGLENHSKKNKAYCSFCELVVPVVEFHLIFNLIRSIMILFIFLVGSFTYFSQSN